MKRKLLSLLVLLLGVFGGANLWAARVDAVWGTPAANGAWDSENNVYSWTLNYSNLATVFETPDGDLANYTALHLTTADYTSEYRVCFMEGSNAKATITFYSAGQKDLVFAERNETKDLDLSTIDHISFGGASGSGSITVTNMYLEGPDAPADIRERIAIPDGSPNGDELTKVVLESDGEGNTLSAKYTITNGTWGNNASHLSIFKFAPLSAATIAGCKKIVVEFDKTIPISNGGATYGFIPVGLVSAVKWTSMGGKDKWEYEFTDEDKNNGINDFSIFFNANGDLKDIEFTITGIYLVKPAIPEKVYDSSLSADVTTFSMDKLNGNEWSFDEPVDISAYKYMIVTTIQSPGNHGNGMRLTDANGFVIGEGWGATKDKGYDASKAGTRGGMWLDRHNNQHCACINLDYLQKEGLDVEHITKFVVPDGSNISAVYLTNYTVGQAVKSKEGGGQCTGDYVRSYDLLEEGKYGMIALKYSAAVSGAKVYTVAGFDANVGLYLTPHYGTLEKGVPYIYEACDFEGHDAADSHKGTNSNVNFYRVDGNQESGDFTPDANGNGLVGVMTSSGFGYGLGSIGGCYIVEEGGIAPKSHSSITTDPQLKDFTKNGGFFDPKKVTSNTTTAKILPVIEFVNLKVSEGKYGTFVAPFEVTVPAGVTTYTAAYNAETNEVDLTEAGSTIAANTPVIVMGSADVNKDFYGAPAKAETVGTELVGILKDNVNVPAGSYVLQTQNEVQQFYKVATEAKGKKNRCYLNIPAASVKVLNIVVDGEETAIMNLDADVNAGKAQIFDLSGRKVSKAQNGIYIVNGRKVVK